MNTPIIDHATLTQEQREEIRKKYHLAKIRIAVGYPNYEDDIIVISQLESIFGKSMFESSAEPLCQAKKGESYGN